MDDSKKIVKSTTPKVSTKLVIVTIPNRCRCSRLDLKTHSLCNRNCGCSKNGSGCSVRCGCKGVCSNGRSITEILFFKVWRNVVIRRAITGEERWEIIRVKTEFRSDLIGCLKRCNIAFKLSDIEHYTRYHLFRREMTLDGVLQKYYRIEKDKRSEVYFNQLVIYSETVGDGSNSKLINPQIKSKHANTYANAVTPEQQSELPPIEKLFDQDLEIIESVKDRIRSAFELEGLEFNGHSPAIQEFFANFNTDPINLLVDKEREIQKILKKEKLCTALESMGIYSIHNQEQVELYLSTFKTQEKMTKGVWEFEEIIEAEKRFHEILVYRKKIFDFYLSSQFKENNLIFRPNSTIINQFIDNICNDDESTPLNSKTTIGPTVEQVIEKEKQVKEALKKKVIASFRKENMYFDEYAGGFIKFIQCSTDSDEANDQLLWQWIEYEISRKIEENEERIIQRYQEYGIVKIYFENDRQTFINNFRLYQISNFPSLTRLAQNELNADIVYHKIIGLLRGHGIKGRKDISKSRAIKQYLEYVKNVFDITGKIDVFIANDIGSLFHVLNAEAFYIYRKEVLKKALNSFGVYRKGSLVDNGNLVNVDDINIIRFLNGEVLEYDVVLYEVFRWKNDTSRKSKNLRSDYVHERLGRSPHWHSVDISLRSRIITHNKYLYYFIYGGSNLYTGNTNVFEILDYQIEVILKYIERNIGHINN